MATTSGGSLDQAFAELIKRVVESTLGSVREELAQIAKVQSPTLAPGASVPGYSVVDLAESVRSILQPTGQTEIMAAALKAVAAVAGSSALFVRRGEAFSTWRSEGCSAEAGNALRSITASAASGAFKELCEQQQVASYPSSSDALPAGLGAVAGARDVCLLPVSVVGKVVAAIAATAPKTSQDLAALEVLSRLTGLSLETSGTRSASPTTSAHQVAPTVQQTPAPSPVAHPAAVVAPAEAPPQVPAASAGLAASNDAAARGSFANVGTAVAVASELPPPPEVESLSEEDRESHKKAHRFARVAVQDLLSYHKNKIAEGRNNRNLYEVLREDIEKTRENYQKKFANTAAASFDYLHYEMVAKLAGNDLSVLGDQYPGPIGA